MLCSVFAMGGNEVLMAELLWQKFMFSLHKLYSHCVCMVVCVRHNACLGCATSVMVPSHAMQCRVGVV